MPAKFVTYEPRIPNNAPLTYLQVDTNFDNVSKQMPIGAIVDYPVNDVIPNTFLECDGAELDGTVYTELFGVLGTTYNTGDEGANGFRVPDSRGYFMRHLGGVDPDTRTIGDTQTGMIESHTHNNKTYRSIDSGGNTYMYSVQGSDDKDVGTQATGGVETRPVNMSVIRIMKASTLVGGS